MPYEWWGEAILTANFVLNRVVTKNREVTPYEGWNRRKPNVSFLKTWGCLAEVNLSEPKKRKLGPKTVDCLFLGYAHNSTTYRFLVVKSNTPEQNVNTIMESRDASFFEDIFPMRAAGSTSQSEDRHSHEHSLENYTQLEPNDEKSKDEHLVDDAPRRSKRQITVKSFGDDFIVYLCG